MQLQVQDAADDRVEEYRRSRYAYVAEMDAAPHYRAGVDFFLEDLRPLCLSTKWPRPGSLVQAKSEAARGRKGLLRTWAVREAIRITNYD